MWPPQGVPGLTPAPRRQRRLRRHGRSWNARGVQARLHAGMRAGFAAPMLLIMIGVTILCSHAAFAQAVRGQPNAGQVRLGQGALNPQVVPPTIDPPAHADASPRAFATGPAASVIAAGLRFMSPRTLEAYAVDQLTIWGLGGLTAIDPSILVAQSGGSLRLTQGHLTLFVAPSPASTDIEGWARTAMVLASHAYDNSAQIRSVGQQAVIQSFFDELFNHMDPYSRYVPPAPADAERDHRTGGAASAGITLTDGERYPSISALNANGPAWAAGVNSGWLVTEVDGHSTRGQPAAIVEGWMRGAPGTPLALSLRAPRSRQTTTVHLARAAVPPETVFAFRNDDILILRITGFAADTAQEVSEFLDEATNAGPGSGKPPAKLRGIIIDLRGNRGGVLQQAVTTVALLLDRGVAVITHGRDPEANHVWSVRGGDLTDGAPVAILVDGRTASAAEVMAAAMSDQRRAVVIGSATLGKGLVQTIGQMPDGGELFVTWSRMLAPQGWPLQGLGVLPQVCTSGGAEAIASQMAALAQNHDLLEQALEDWRHARAPLPSSRVIELRANCAAAIGTDADLEAARQILNDPTRYRAALIAPGDANVSQVYP